MGKHYIPRYYLKGFSISENNNQIVTYRCQPEKKFVTNIDNIAQETDMYSDEKEKFLAENIEEPANEILRKIKLREKLSSEDKMVFSNYLVAIIKRVPTFLNLIKSKIPDAVQQIKQNVKEKYNKQLLQNQINKQNADNIYQAIDEFELTNIFNDEKMREIWLEFIPPEMTPLIQNEICSKKWVFLINQTNQYIITCDNPLFFFKGIGLRNSEFTFPITKEIALNALNNSNLPDFATPRTQIFKEINRRSISNANNYIYSPKEEIWLWKTIQKRRNIHLDRIYLL